MDHSEKTLFDVLRDVWRAKFYLLFFGIVGIICAFAFLRGATPYYKAEMLLGPAHGFAQIAMPVMEGTIQTQPQTLSSDVAFERFEQTYYAPSVVGNMLIQANVQDALTMDRAFWFLPRRGAPVPEYIRKAVRLEPVSGTSFRRMVYYHPEPKFAKGFIQRIHKAADENIRLSVLRETNARISYLNEALGRVSNPDHKRSLAALLMEQERMRMMVSLDQPFAAAVIEPAYVSRNPRWPDGFIIYPVFLFVGLLAGFVVYGLRRARG